MTMNSMEIDYSEPAVDLDVDFPYHIDAIYPSLQAALDDGWKKNQVWSVIVTDEVDDQGNDVVYDTYGPPHHYVNVMHYVATKETHDMNTYYNERYIIHPPFSSFWNEE